MKSSNRKFYQLFNHYGISDGSYIPIIVTTIYYFFYRTQLTDLNASPGLFLLEQHNGCRLWNRICLPYWCTCQHSLMLVGFVLLSLQNCLSCFVIFFIVFPLLPLSSCFRLIGLNITLVCNDKIILGICVNYE